MHRASPTLPTRTAIVLATVLATCCAAAVMAAAPARAEESPEPTPGPVLLSPSPRPTATTTPTATATPTGAPASAASPDGSPEDTAEPSPSDTLVSVNVAMPATTVDGPTAVTPRAPRTSLPLRQGHAGAKVALAQERLSWLGYVISDANTARASFGRSTAAAVRAFQSKNWLRPTGRIDQRTWRALRKQAEPRGILPLRCTQVKKALCIDKSTRTLRLVVKGTVVLTTDARFGAPGMETGEGIFSVKEKSYNHTSSRYGTWMPRAMFFNGDEAVHYSPDFAAVGYARGSHGCVGVRDLDIATELFDRVPVGTRVYVYWS